MSTQRVFVFLLVLASALPLRAAAITGSSASGQDTTDRNAFNATLTGLTVTNIDFESATLGDYSSTGLQNYVITGLSFSGFNSANAGDLHVLTAPNWLSGGSKFIDNTGSNGHITVTFPPNTFAFGLDLLIVSGLTNSCCAFSISYNNGSNVNDTSAAAVSLGGSVFYGVRSPTAITSVTFNVPFSSDQLGIDNFECGIGSTPADTPEAATFLLLGSGLIAMRWLHLRRRRSPKPQAEARFARYPQAEPGRA